MSIRDKVRVEFAELLGGHHNWADGISFPVALCVPARVWIGRPNCSHQRTPFGNRRPNGVGCSVKTWMWLSTIGIRCRHSHAVINCSKIMVCRVVDYIDPDEAAGR